MRTHWHSSGATGGSSTGLCMLRLLRTPYFWLEIYHFEVHFEAQKLTPPGTLVSSFSLFSVSLWGAVCSENFILYNEDSIFLGPFWAPERGPPSSWHQPALVSSQPASSGVMLLLPKALSLGGGLSGFCLSIACLCFVRWSYVDCHIYCTLLSQLLVLC